MDKFVIKRPRSPCSAKNRPAVNLNSRGNADSNVPVPDTHTNKRANIEFNPKAIKSDPRERDPIDEYNVNIRDQVRRAYIAKGPFQPSNHKFPKKKINDEVRTFQAKWFKEFDWLEYSVLNDEVYCFPCYLFNPNRADNTGKNAFTSTGFGNWRKALVKFRAHVGSVGSSHNEATRRFQAFKNQKQSISHIFSAQGYEIRSKAFHILIELALILPVATATVERVFSAMKILKTYERNRMGDEWLNDSMMVYIEKAIFAKVDNEAILQHYQNMQNRRIQLSSVISSSKSSPTVGN